MHTWKKWYIISESMNKIKQNINMNVNILVPIYMYWSSLLVHILSNYSIMIKWYLKKKQKLFKKGKATIQIAEPLVLRMYMYVVYFVDIYPVG